MTDKIKRFIECIVPVTACTLKCHYCYVIQNEYRHENIPKFLYSAKHIRKALSVERLGGICFFNLCGAGETLLSKELIDIVEELLKEGHYVNITTNGTLTKRFQEFAKLPSELCEKLLFSFSFHYLELKRLNLLKTFFSNINLVRNAGCSILVQLNMVDEYIPYLEDIKNLCLENVGALPHLALTRDELAAKDKIYSKLNNEEYYKLGQPFESGLWDFTNKNFNIKRNEYCYAGEWSMRLDIATGDVKRCYFEDYSMNLFENLEQMPKFEAIGRNCRCSYCANSTHFISLGVIPSIVCGSYSSLRNRKCFDDSYWQSEKMKDFLNSKLYESNIRKFEERFNLDKIFSVKKLYIRRRKYFIINTLGIKTKIKSLMYKQCDKFNKGFQTLVAVERERERERERE